MTIIKEARDLSTFKVKELVESLRTYEISLYRHEEKELKRKEEKGVALKTDIEEKSDKNSEDVESELSNHEMAFLARKFRNFTRNKNYFPKKRKSNRKESSKEVRKKGEKNVLMCLSVINYCILDLNVLISLKSIKKKKAFMAVWDDNEYSSSEDE